MNKDGSEWTADEDSANRGFSEQLAYNGEQGTPSEATDNGSLTEESADSTGGQEPLLTGCWAAGGNRGDAERSSNRGTGEAAKSGVFPVSYTHLTLPTTERV